MLAVLSGPGAGGGHLPHRDDPVPGDAPPRRACCSWCWSGSPPGSRSARWPARCRSSTWAAALWRSPTGCRWPGSPARRRCPAGPGRPGGGDRLPRPVHRAAQGLRGPAGGVRRAGRRTGPACACSWPAPATRTKCSRRCPPGCASRITFLGMVSEADKARMLRSVDVYVAPNTGGESFGMILTEAMAAGTPVVASDLDAFRRVLDGGRAGGCSRPGTPTALADRLGRTARRRRRAAPSCRRTRARWSPAYDWPVVAQPGAGGLRHGDRGRRRGGARRRAADVGARASPAADRYAGAPRPYGYDAAHVVGGGRRRRGRARRHLCDLDRGTGRPAARAGRDRGPGARRAPGAPGRGRRRARRGGRRSRSCTRRPGPRWTPAPTSGRRPRTTSPASCARDHARPGRPDRERVVAASRRVALARQVHTDLVRDALAAALAGRWSGCCGLTRGTRARVLRHRRPHPRPVTAGVTQAAGVRWATGQATRA